MKKIKDDKLLKEYIKKYNMNDLFSKDMFSYMTLYLYDKNEYICKEGEELNNIFFIVSGRVKVCKNLANGKSMIACFYDGFKIIGDVEFTKSDIANCSVQTITDVYAVAIKLQIVREILCKDPIFLLYICSYLGDKLDVSCNNGSINAVYSLEERLAGYIYAFVYECSEEEIIFEFGASYLEIAELLGTSYRHLHRTLKKFCEDNILEKKNKKYVVKNLKRLKELASDLYRM